MNQQTGWDGCRWKCCVSLFRYFAFFHASSRSRTARTTWVVLHFLRKVRSDRSSRGTRQREKSDEEKDEGVGGRKTGRGKRIDHKYVCRCKSGARRNIPVWRDMQFIFLMIIIDLASLSFLANIQSYLSIITQQTQCVGRLTVNCFNDNVYFRN